MNVDESFFIRTLSNYCDNYCTNCIRRFTKMCSNRKSRKSVGDILCLELLLVCPSVSGLAPGHLQLKCLFGNYC